MALPLFSKGNQKLAINVHGENDNTIITSEKSLLTTFAFSHSFESCDFSIGLFCLL
jgi:hypothetical protein